MRLSKKGDATFANVHELSLPLLELPIQLEMGVDEENVPGAERVSLSPMIVQVENRHANMIYSQTVPNMPDLKRGDRTDIQVQIPLTLPLIGALEATRIETDGDVHFLTKIHAKYQYISSDAVPSITTRQIFGNESWRITSSDWVRKALQGRTLIELSKGSAMRLEELRVDRGKVNLDELISEFYEESQKPGK